MEAIPEVRVAARQLAALSEQTLDLVTRLEQMSALRGGSVAAGLLGLAERMCLLGILGWVFFVCAGILRLNARASRPPARPEQCVNIPLPVVASARPRRKLEG